MSQNAAPQDEPGSNRRLVRATLVAVSAAALVALGAPAAGHASHGTWSWTDKSDTHKPVGAGSGRRIR